MANMTWEQAVIWLRQQEQYRELVYAGYLDDPLLEAVKRFADSEEWAAVRRLIAANSQHRTLSSECRPGGRSQKALDVGAGRGIASYALARDRWEVTALEPDRSDVVGAGAIRQLAHESGLPIKVVDRMAESLPFEDEAFDLVYGRQVFHHITDIYRACSESFRVLKPGGQLAFFREHVISRNEDIEAFWAGHVAHQLCGGENARLVAAYKGAIMAAGFRSVKVLGPWDNVINFFPASREQWRAECAAPLVRRLGWRVAMGLVNERHILGHYLLPLLAQAASRRDKTPGRLYSFLARK